MSKTEREELPENEEYISRDDIDIEVITSDNNEVFVRFGGFEDQEEADAYAELLAETLPLLLFGTSRLQ